MFHSPYVTRMSGYPARLRLTGRVTNIVSRGRHGLSAEIVLLHVIAKGPEAHPEELRGLHLNAAGALEGLRDVAALDLLDVGLEVEPRIRQAAGGRAVARSGAPDRRWEALGQNRRRGFESDRPFQHVFQLADVAGPVVQQE